MLPARHLGGAEGSSGCRVPPERSGALLDKVVRRPAAWPAGRCPVAISKQQEARERQRSSGLQVVRPAPGPGADRLYRVKPAGHQAAGRDGEAGSGRGRRHASRTRRGPSENASATPEPDRPGREPPCSRAAASKRFEIVRWIWRRGPDHEQSGERQGPSLGR